MPIPIAVLVITVLCGVYSIIGVFRYFEDGGKEFAEDEIPNRWKRFLYIALHGPIVWVCILVSEVVAPIVYNIVCVVREWFKK